MALSSPHLSICLLISILYACTNSQTSYSLNPLIQQVCAQTTYPPFCQWFLSDHPRSAEATDKHALGLIAMERIQFHARAMVIKITNNLILSPQTTPAMREKLRQCSAEYNFIIRDTQLAYRYWVNNLSNAVHITSNSALANKGAVQVCRRAVGADYQPLARLNRENERYQEILLTVCDFNPHQTSANV